MLNMLLTNHFPEEIRKEIELDKIKVTEKSSMGNITLTGRDPQRAAKIKIKRAKKGEGTYGKVDKSKGRISHFLWATLNMQEPDLSRFLLKNGKSGPGYGYNVVWES
jgi:hypothetical protein